MQRDLELIINWQRDSGLGVNHSKNELCYFNKQDEPHISINLHRVKIDSKSQTNVLGVIFDTKLQWAPKIAQTISKAKQALHSIRFIRTYFNTGELGQN